MPLPIRTYFKIIVPYVLFAGLVLAIMWPLYRPGYIFLLDMVWGPALFEQTFTQGLQPHTPLLFIIKMLSSILPLPVIQKILLSLILFAIPASMYRLSRHYMPQLFATLSGVIYVCNPWVYERFLAGHWLVLSGYALFPLVLLLFDRWLKKSSFHNLWPLALLLALYPILSLHWSYIAALFLIGLMVIAWLSKTISLKTFFTHERLLQLGILSGLIISINAFWLVGFFDPQVTYNQISTEDFAAYQTVADPQYGVVINTLSLYGFWSSDYILPKQTLSYWWLYPVLMIGLSIIGLVYSVRKKLLIGFGLALAALPAVLVGIGYGLDALKPLINALYAVLPGFKGLRETAKVLGVVAAIYAFLAPLGIASLAYKISCISHIKKPLADYSLALTAAIVSLVSVHLMFFGFAGQVVPRGYPTGWHDARLLLSTEESQHILVLPWHQYMVMSFANYHNISNPAERFFSEPLITSTLLDNAYLAQTRKSRWDQIVFNLVHGQQSFDVLYPDIKAQQVSHIMLLKELDWQRYEILDQAQLLEKTFDTEHIALYRLK